MASVRTEPASACPGGTDATAPLRGAPTAVTLTDSAKSIRIWPGNAAVMTDGTESTAVLLLNKVVVMAEIMIKVCSDAIKYELFH